MNKYLAQVLKHGVALLSQGEAKRFEEAIAHPRETQRALLKEILTQHESTEYGQAHGILSHWSESEFRSRLPITDFNDEKLLPWIEKQQASPQASIITPGGVRIFEKTSGSSGKQKLIPYNHALLSGFERYFKIWIYDLFTKGPELESLRIFISISPAFKEAEDLSSKVGFEDDSEYLSWPLRMLLKIFLSVPLDIKSIQDPDQFRDTLCSYLVSDARLEIISVWHPSFMTVLWEHLLTRRRYIAQLVKARNPRAANLLDSDQALRPTMFWPDLKIISAWDAAQSALSAQRLQSLFPSVFFQGKGLLATEAPMTLPLIGHGPIPFITDVLFEFMASDGHLRWIDELKDGEDYSLLISQKGGLLRYRIRDRVRAFATSVGTPRLEFLGRENDTSDLVGEKLSAGFIASHEPEFSEKYGASSYLILPIQRSEQEKPGYVVLADTAFSAKATDDEIANWWDTHLCDAYHYGYARKLGQLSPVRAFRVGRLQKRLLDYYVEQKGMRAGDIKLPTFLNNPDESLRILSHLNILENTEETRR